MEVITWQLLIIGSIVLCQRLSPKGVTWLCGGWTLFSLFALFYPPLIAIQLVSIWGTWFILQRLAKQKSEISARDEIIKGLSAEARSVVLKTPVERQHIIRDKEHLAFLERRIGLAVDEIIVLSGWISDRVVNDRFINILDRKLREGCRVFWVTDGKTHRDGTKCGKLQAEH